MFSCTACASISDARARGHSLARATRWAQGLIKTPIYAPDSHFVLARSLAKSKQKWAQNVVAISSAVMEECQSADSFAHLERLRNALARCGDHSYGVFAINGSFYNFWSEQYSVISQSSNTIVTPRPDMKLWQPKLGVGVGFQPITGSMLDQACVFQCVENGHELERILASLMFCEFQIHCGKTSSQIITSFIIQTTAPKSRALWRRTSSFASSI